MKGLNDCFAYKVSFDEEIEKHTCRALELNKATNKPFCVGAHQPKQCSFYKTRAQHKADLLKAERRNALIGYVDSDRRLQEMD